MKFIDTGQLEDLKAFMVDWYGGYDDSYGVPEKEIPEFLPKALKELYAFAGRWKDGSPGHMENSPEIFQHQDALFCVEHLSVKEGRVTFVMENQGNWTCQVEAGNDDSPVYSDAYLSWTVDASEPAVVSESIYHFLKTFCLQEIVLGCKHLYGVYGSMEDTQGVFKDSLEEIWIDGHYVYPEGEEPTHMIYRCGDALLMEMNKDLWLGYNSDSPSAINLEELSKLRTVVIQG